MVRESEKNSIKVMMIDQIGFVIVKTYMRRMQVECEDVALVVRRNQYLLRLLYLYIRDSYCSRSTPLFSFGYFGRFKKCLSGDKMRGEKKKASNGKSTGVFKEMAIPSHPKKKSTWLGTPRGAWRGRGESKESMFRDGSELQIRQ